MLKTCNDVNQIIWGRNMHTDIAKGGFEGDSAIGNALVSMYAKCGMLVEALEVFDKLAEQTTVSWTTVIAGYIKLGFNEKALRCLEQMQLQGILIDDVTFLCGLRACANTNAFYDGLAIHAQIVEEGFDGHTPVCDTLVDMYARCGSSMEAHRAFEKAHIRNEVSWTALISAFVQDGNFELVRKCLKHMVQDGFMPDGQTFTSILAAYSNSGQMDANYQCLESMNDVHEISPTIEHMNCIIDTLARVGHLHEAEELLQTMPMPPDSTGWVSLLTACQTYGNMGVGWQCLNEVVKIDLCGTGSYMTIANICAVS